MTTNIYLTFDGNCEEVFNYYKSIFGGEFENMSRFSEMPPSDEFSIDDADKDKIMHVSMSVNNQTFLMGSDTTAAFGPPPVVGSNFSISVAVDSRGEADRVFAALSEGGMVTMPLADTFWESYFGSCIDKFGINWMVDCPAT